MISHSPFTEAYKNQCLDAAVKLLDQICRGIKPASYGQNLTDIPVACMHLVALVSDFVLSNKQQVGEGTFGSSLSEFERCLTEM